MKKNSKKDIVKRAERKRKYIDRIVDDEQELIDEFQEEE